MEDSNLKKEGLPKIFKLRTKKEYKEVLENGKVIKGFFLIASFLKRMKESLESLLTGILKVELKGIR